MTRNLEEKLFLLAGVSNILGVLVLSKFFTNQVMMEVQPTVMGSFGLVMIVVWGLAYIAVSKTYQNVRWLVGVFAVEKLVYVIAWLMFVSTRSLAEVFEADTFAGLFCSVYGVNDFAFMLFFAYIFLKYRKHSA